MTIPSSSNDHFDSWLEAVSSACGRYDATRLSEASRGSISMSRRAALEVATIDVTQTRLKRTERDVKDDDGKSYFMIAQLEGQSRMEQGSNRNVLLPGDLMLLDSCRPSDFQYDTSSRQLSLIIPREFFNAQTFRGSVNCGVKIPASSNTATMARMLVSEAISHSSLGVQDSEAVLAAVVCLLGPVIGSRSEAISTQEKVFKRAMVFIEQNLHLPELSPGLVAKEIGVSLRGLYRCFAEHDLVVAKHIRDRRLDICAELIRRNDASPVADLAHTWGFNEPSYFSTAFRQRFQMSPSEYRKRYSGT